MFVSRDFASRSATAKYQAVIVQIRLWKAWFKRRWPAEALEKTPKINSNLFILQYYRNNQASPPIARLKSVQIGIRQPFKDPRTIKFDRGRKPQSQGLDILVESYTSPLLSLDRINAMDGAAIFLVGATALTINIRTWTKLAV